MANELKDGFPDRFKSLGEIRQALRNMGFRKCGLIFGIDYTMSNKVQGERSFGGKSLHDLEGEGLNPYQEVISILGETLEEFDSDGFVPAYGFGDKQYNTLFPLKRSGASCRGFKEVLRVYNEVTPDVEMYRPTNFAPLIHQAIAIVKQTRKYHILVIVADGQVNSEEDTIHAIVEAAKWPLSIVVVGVGDGPWGMMKTFDDSIPRRNFDNFQFVDFHEVTANARDKETAFALHCLMEIPDQFRVVHELGLIEQLKS